MPVGADGVYTAPNCTGTITAETAGITTTGGVSTLTITPYSYTEGSTTKYGIIKNELFNFNSENNTRSTYFDKSTVQFINADKIANYCNSESGPAYDGTYLSGKPTIATQSGTGGLPSTIDSDLSNMTTYNNTVRDKLDAEYCYYFLRYKYVLERYFATGGQTPENLEFIIKYNYRLNALIQIIDFLSKQRIASLNGLKTFVNDTNNELNRTIDTISPSASLLTIQNSIINTRKEMIRYTTEKNNHITNQISLWAALNVIAIASILTVYRSMS
jgi:hypothetical protein